MPDVERCIDDIQYANYNIPTLQYGQRVLKQRDRHVQLGAVYEYTEEDYVDAREPRTYRTPDVEFAPALTAEQHTRLDVINALLQSMVNGRGCTDKQLKRVLTAEQHHDYINAASTQQHPSEIEYGNGMPHDLRSYKYLLQQADFYYNRFDRLSSLRSSGRVRYTEATVKSAENKAESLYEDALERLEEIWTSAGPYEQHQIQNWMDREIDFDAGYDRKIGIDPVQIPRVRGSKSVNALDSGLPKLSKRLKRTECQLIALRSAAWSLAFKQLVEEPQDTAMKQVESKKLKDLLRTMRGEDDEY
jgi:hypothetical protein